MSEYRETPDPTRAESERIWDTARKQVREENEKDKQEALLRQRKVLSEATVDWLRRNLQVARRLTPAQETALRKFLAGDPAPDAPTPGSSPAG